jgi:hypothetical protein
MPNQVQLFNSDPNIQANAALIQQRMALAQALMQQGLQPLDTSNRSVGGVAYHVSPFEGAAKIAQAYFGAKGMQDAVKAQGALAAQAYGNLLQKYQPGSDASYSGDQISNAASTALSGGGGPTNDNATKMASLLVNQNPANRATVNPNNPANLPANLMADYAAGFIPDKAFETQASRYQATDATKMATQGGTSVAAANQGALAKANTDPELLKLEQAGFTPQQRLAYMQAKARKDTYVAPVDVKPGTPLVDPFDGHLLAYAPKTADGMTLQFTRDQNGALVPAGARAIPGYAGGNAQIAGAEQGARQANTIMTVSGADNTPVTSWGANFAGTPGGFKGPNPTQQGDLQKRWGDLYNQAGQAQAVINNLQQIKTYAEKARTGAFSDRAQLADAVLSMLNSNDATQRQMANNLLGKNASQITARLSQGNLSTDAARELIMSAYPNAHMVGPAIQEAADNLIAAQQMNQAKAQILLPHYLAGNPQQYQAREAAFDAAADPRIFQWKNMPPGKAKDDYKAQILSQDPTLIQKAQMLEQLGVK